MGSPRRLAALTAVLLLSAGSGCVAGGGRDDAARGTPGDIPMPASLAALGDSITQALASCDNVADCSHASWSTGTAPDLGSHYQRIAEARGREPEVHNLAVNGATVSDLDAQARKAVAAKVQYVTVLIGANDACAATEAATTPLEEFTAAFTRAMDTLVKGLPRAWILVVSIPDLARLWRVGKDDPDVRATWQRFGICQSMLADPTSTGDRAQDRRSRVRDRVIHYNRAMAAVCRQHPTCRWDGNAVFNYDLSLEMVSPYDYWHPGVLGQRTLAEISWRAGYWA